MIANGMVTPKIYPLSVVVVEFVLFEVFPFVELFGYVIPLHEAHLLVASFQVYE
jgi:hypothetical protein